MLHLCAGFFQQHLHILHGLVGLSRRIATAHEAAIEGKASLSAQKNEIAGAHRHAHLVLHVMILVKHAGIEAAKTLMLHRASP